MVKHNNRVPNNHFHKQWKRRVRTWFNQPMRHKRRHETRVKKAAEVAPRPLKKLRPVVRCPTIKHNTKVRLGKGFTVMELEEAGIHPKIAQTIGIAVDMRRRNHSVETKNLNVSRLRDYKSKLVLFNPQGLAKYNLMGDKNKKRDGKDTVVEVEGDSPEVKQITTDIMPIERVTKRNRHELQEVQYAKITDSMKAFRAFNACRKKKLPKYKLKALMKEKEAKDAEKEMKVD